MKKKKRFNREDWLSFGLKQLAASGPDALKLTELCAVADKTIGSFYHHFDDQSAYFDAMLAHWKKINTLDVIDGAQVADDGNSKAKELEKIALALDHAQEVGLRSFAHQHKAAAVIVAEVDAMRIAYLKALYQERFTLSDNEAQTLAEVEYAGFVGAQIIWPSAPPEFRENLSTVFHRMVAKFIG